MKKLPLNITDQELCNLFREAVKNYHPSYEQKSWDQLSHMMEHKKKSGILHRNRKRIIAMILLILLPVFFVVQHDYFSVPQARPVSLTTTAALPAPPRGAGNLKTSNSGKHPAPNNHPVTYRKGFSANRRQTLKTGGTAGPWDPGKNSLTPGMIARTDLPYIQGTKIKMTEVLPARLAQADLSFDEPPDQTDLSINRGGPVTAQTRDPRWNISLAIGPDWGTVGFKQWTKPGIDAGIFASYRFAKKWSVTSGISLSSTIYVAAPGDYHPKVDNWSSIDLQQIDASCRILDIPINLRYDLYEHNGNRIFASTGISSFWMKRENYVYEYHVSGNIQRQSSVYRNDNRHLFSVWNISAGYETKISPHFSLQATPFIKLPLHGIGYGRVRLTSTGIRISAKYHF